jgi:hypothetical protein
VKINLELHIASSKTAIFHITTLWIAGFQIGYGDAGYK